MLTNYANKSVTTEADRQKREAEFEKLITAAMLREDHVECNRLRALRRAELRGRSKYPPEPVGSGPVRIYDARGRDGAPELLYDSQAEPEPLKVGNQRVVLTESQQSRWKR